MKLRLTQMALDVHKANARWWIDLETGQPLQRNWGEMCMLVVSELAEALEGHRKGLMDDKLPHRPMLEVELADALIRLLDISGHDNLDLDSLYGVVDEAPVNVGEALLVITRAVLPVYETGTQFHYLGVPCFSTYQRDMQRCIMTLLNVAEMLKVDIEGAYHEKMVYNAQRIDHTLEHRKGAGGKKY